MVTKSTIVPMKEIFVVENGLLLLYGGPNLDEVLTSKKN